MRLSTIEFNGYKRLSEASCNVDGPAIAFIGPNESGKSSILQGLAWLTDPSNRVLDAVEQSRRKPPDPQSTLVVRAHFRIDDDDIALLGQLDIDPTPPVGRKTVTTFRLSRRADGGRVTGLTSSLKRNPRPFQDALAAAVALGKQIGKLAERTDSDELPAIGDTVSNLVEDLNPPDSAWDPERLSHFPAHRAEVQRMVDSLAAIEDPWAASRQLLQALERLLSRITTAETAAAKPDPNDAIRGVLQGRVPRFLLFSDDDREIAADYSLSDNALRDDPPAPLRNLLLVAGTDVDELWGTLQNGDLAMVRTLQRRLNETLRSRLAPMWTQSRLTVELTLNQDGLLEVNIQELDSPDYAVTPIAERSDGLRAFLGLVCFLTTQQLDRPPVLMIDEAERNLHYDAQADLVRVLTRELEVHKVLYTTHSPGCLPLDLGTGIRVVKRDPEDAGSSKLENTFWTKSDPGFSHLLFAMGAEAAAFSAFRRAVLAEGVSEMILLPTLLRNASDGRQLDFQVAFGLSNMAAASALGTVALVTTFLVDGDAAGDRKKTQLREAGFPDSHIFQLPRGKALEDLVDRTTYLKILNELLAESGQAIPNGSLAAGTTIARAVDDYARTHLDRPDGVSHKIVASRLAELGDDLKLSAAGKKCLAHLRDELDAAFAHPYQVG